MVKKKGVNLILQPSVPLVSFLSLQRFSCLGGGGLDVQRCGWRHYPSLFFANNTICGFSSREIISKTWRTQHTKVTVLIHTRQEKKLYSWLHQTTINLTKRAAWLNIACKMGETRIPYRKVQSYCQQLSTQCRLQNVYTKWYLTLHSSKITYTTAHYKTRSSTLPEQQQGF